MEDDQSEWLWIGAKDHYLRPLNMVIDVIVKWSPRKKGWMVKVFNRLTHKLEPYQAGPFSTREEAFGIGDFYIKTRLQLMDHLMRPSTEQQD